MKYKVFVDGSEGTTGLKINEQLALLNNIEILSIDIDKRKDINARKELLNSADIAFLCLPDTASIEAVSLVENPKTVIIDASVAFRTNSNWAYGLPEISKQHKEKIMNSKRIAVPGCHATGFTTAVYPLIANGFIDKDYPISCQSITGYSGGGKSLIARFEDREDKTSLKSPQFYALGLSHKHLPEMQIINGLTYKPLFTPIVGDFFRGMCVAIPLHKRLMKKNISQKELLEFYKEYYQDQKNINVFSAENEQLLDNGFLDATKCNNTNNLDICVFSNDQHFLVISRLDNLGKGASGAAVQCMELAVRN